ncbi:MAG TPA: HEAT repeat domain-containing protein, partial [Elusimicrobiota bacterium]|nr:HEAT repeat domain-containing protein [Elusimicrobiota bacterium]
MPSRSLGPSLAAAALLLIPAPARSAASAREEVEKIFHDARVSQGDDSRELMLEWEVLDRNIVLMLPPSEREGAFQALADFLRCRRKFVVAALKASQDNDWKPAAGYLGTMLERWRSLEPLLPGEAWRNKRLLMPEDACPLRCGVWFLEGMSEVQQRFLVGALPAHMSAEPYAYQATAAQAYCDARQTVDQKLYQAARDAIRAADLDQSGDVAPYCTWLLASLAAHNGNGIEATVAKAQRLDPRNPFLSDLQMGGSGASWTRGVLGRELEKEHPVAHRPIPGDQWEISVQVLPSSPEPTKPAAPRKRRAAKRRPGPAYKPVTGLTPTDPARLPELERTLSEAERPERLHAVAELGNMGEPGLPVLARALDDGDWEVRLTAVHWLGRLGPAGADDLVRAMREDPCRIVRLTAIHWLGSLGPEYLPELSLAQDDPSAAMRSASRYWSHRVRAPRDHDLQVDFDDRKASVEDKSVCERMNAPRPRSPVELASASGGPRSTSPADSRLVTPSEAFPDSAAPLRGGTPDPPPSPSEAFPDGAPAGAGPEASPSPESFPPAGSLARNDPSPSGDASVHPQRPLEPEPFVDPKAKPMKAQVLPPYPTPPPRPPAEAPAAETAPAPPRAAPDGSVASPLGT